MTRSLPKLVIIAPLLVASASVWGSDIGAAANPFGFNPEELDSIQFTRSRPELASVSVTDESGVLPDTRGSYLIQRQTEFSFKLKPKRPDFSREGAYGLNLFTAPRLDVHQRLMGPGGLDMTISDLNDGFEYSAGVRVEHDEADSSGTAYVSSSLLGVSYGRLGRLWYGGIDVNLERFADEYYGGDQADILSLDLTTGRRLGFTGLGTHSPLWLLSVKGNFDMNDEPLGSGQSRSDWYLNPSLFWQQPGFTFSAQMQLPVEFETLNDAGEPDYRLRAVFQKQFK